MSQTLTKPILLDETGQAIKTALQNIDETESQDWLLTYEDVHSEMDDNVDRIADALESIKDVLEGGEWYPANISVEYTGSPSNPYVGFSLNLNDIQVTLELNRVAEISGISGMESKYIDISNLCSYSHDNGDMIGTLNNTITATWIYGKTGQSYSGSVTIPVQVPRFSQISFDDEYPLVVQALNAHYAGVTDLTEYWSVGDKARIVLKGQLDSGDTANTVRDMYLVILNVGGKELSNPTTDVTECAFIVGTVKILETWSSQHTYSVPITKKFMDTSSAFTNDIGWDNCDLRTWCNTTFKDSLYTFEWEDATQVPKTKIEIFKQFNNITAETCSTPDAVKVSQDYFELPAEKEMFGTNVLSAESDLTQFEYYKDSANRIGYYENPVTANEYGTRTVGTNISSLSGVSHVLVSTTGDKTGTSKNGTMALRLFGVI